jgi:nucleoside-diphosphate kinase
MGFTVGVVKPDATGRLGEILERVTRAGFVVDEVRVLRLSNEEAREFYAEHAIARPPWLDTHIEHVTSGAVVFLVLSMPALDSSGELSVSKLRELLGATDPRAAAPGSIRGDFGTDLTRNAMHGSSDARAAVRELKLLRRFCLARGDSSLVPPRVG